jgi:hypothetical protein
MPRSTTFAILVLLAGAAPVYGQVQTPDPTKTTISTPSPGPFSLFCVPNGSGNDLLAAYEFGGTPANAQIHLTMRDANNVPVINFPYEQIWIESSGTDLYLCPPNPNRLATIANADTDISGSTDFLGPFHVGGHHEPPNVLEFWVELANGSSLLVGTGAPVSFNSPDLTQDGIVNISDVIVFSNIWFGAYEYRGDFLWDGAINISDLVLFSQALSLGAQCP